MTAPRPWPRSSEPVFEPSRRPPPPSRQWHDVMGDYCRDGEWLSVFERDSRLWMALHGREAWPVSDVGTERVAVERRPDLTAMAIERGAQGRAVAIIVDGRRYRWRALSPDPTGQLRVVPVRPIPDVLADARRDTPLSEPGDFRASELVDLLTLDPTIRLDLRYASDHNFLGHPFYAAPRALLQRPIADAVAAAHAALRSRGFGLVILDAYRPWFVSKAFWEATPVESRWIVADPARGSRHNRGAAVDVTLEDLETGALADMPSTFDEPTPRACAFYPGGSSLQRWHRALLRQVMECEGFTVNDYEWWHFDHRDWARYRIENHPVE